jgi:protein SCO1/2
LPLLALLLLLAGCGGQKPVASNAPIKEYTLKGEVVSLVPRSQAANIKHEKIEGWMEAMTMEFPVKDKAEFDTLRPGDRITAIVYVQDADYWIGRIQRNAGDTP